MDGCRPPTLFFFFSFSREECPLIYLFFQLLVTRERWREREELEAMEARRKEQEAPPPLQSPHTTNPPTPPTNPLVTTTGYRQVQDNPGGPRRDAREVPRLPATAGIHAHDERAVRAEPHRQDGEEAGRGSSPHSTIHTNMFLTPPPLTPPFHPSVYALNVCCIKTSTQKSTRVIR